MRLSPANRPARQEWDMDNLKRLDKLQLREVGGKGAHPHESGVWFGSKALSWHTFHRGESTLGTFRRLPVPQRPYHIRRKSLTATPPVLEPLVDVVHLSVSFLPRRQK